MDQRFSLNRVIARTGDVLRERWAHLVVVMLTLGVALPMAVNHFIGGEAPVGLTSLVVGATAPVQVLARLVMLAIGALGTGAVLSVALTPRGERLAWASPYRAALIGLPAVWLASLVIGVPALLILWIPEAVRLISPGDGSHTATVGGVALLRLAAGLVGITAATFLGMAGAAVIGERLGPIAALRRSLRLTRGRRGLLFGLGLAMALLYVLSYAVTSMITRWFPPEQMTDAYRLLNAVLRTPVRVVEMVFLAAVFLELRRLVDPPAAETAEVFD